MNTVKRCCNNCEMMCKTPTGYACRFVMDVKDRKNMINFRSATTPQTICPFHHWRDQGNVPGAENQPVAVMSIPSSEIALAIAWSIKCCIAAGGAKGLTQVLHLGGPGTGCPVKIEVKD